MFTVKIFCQRLYLQIIHQQNLQSASHQDPIVMPTSELCLAIGRQCVTSSICVHCVVVDRSEFFTFVRLLMMHLGAALLIAIVVCGMYACIATSSDPLWFRVAIMFSK